MLFRSGLFPLLFVENKNFFYYTANFDFVNRKNKKHQKM
jgi:hypothetical protein